VLHRRNPCGIETKASQSPAGDFVYGDRDLGPGWPSRKRSTLATELLIAPFHFRALVSFTPFERDLVNRLADFVLRGLQATDS
jgi:hypothetical protein